MGHCECPITLDVYSKTWWDERAAAVSAVVDLVMNADESTPGENQQADENPRQMLFSAAPEPAPLGVPTSAPAPETVQLAPGISLEAAEKNGRGERI
jgi:hypothetical protein